MENLIFTGVSLDELLQRIEELFEAKLAGINSPEKPTGDFITRKEVSQLLKISLPTLHEWTKQGWLKSYKIGNRVLYKKAEVENSLKTIFNPTQKRNIQ